MIRTIHVPNNDVLSALYVVFVVGGDALELKGREFIRLRSRVIKEFNAVSKETENMRRVAMNEDGTATLKISQAEYELFDKCFDKIDVRTAFAPLAEAALDCFSTAEKE